MKDGDRVQVQPIQVKSTEWLLRDKVKDLERILKKKNEYIDTLLERLGE